MTIAYCTCGHAQIFHMGPTGPCHDRVPAKDADSKPTRCPCPAFKLADRFSKRADLA